MNILYIFLPSVFFVLLGLYIWKKGIVNFIAGYQENSIYDEQLLAKKIGIVIIAFGVECLICILINLYIFSFEAFYIGVLAIIHIIIILILFIHDQLKK